MTILGAIGAWQRLHSICQSGSLRCFRVSRTCMLHIGFGQMTYLGCLFILVVLKIEGPLSFSASTGLFI